MSLDRYQQARRVIEILEAPLALEGYDLLDVRLFRGGGRLTVRVFLDGQDGLNLDACAKASRTVGMLLEEADLFPDAYVIEVSSPGIRRPLRTNAHFEAAVGQKVVLKVASGDRVRTHKGVLASFTDATLTLDVEQKQEHEDEQEQEQAREKVITRERVREASLDPDFDPRSLIAEDRRRRKEERQQEKTARRQERKGR